jgi:hypothetical protein
MRGGDRRAGAIVRRRVEQCLFLAGFNDTSSDEAGLTAREIQALKDQGVLGEG